MFNTCNYELVLIVNIVQHCLFYLHTEMKYSKQNSTVPILLTFDTPSVLSSQLKTMGIYMWVTFWGSKIKEVFLGMY